MIGGRQIERPLQQRIAEVRPLEIHAHLEPRGADAVLVWVIDVEHQLKRAAREAHAGDVDLLQFKLGLAERELAEGGAGAERQQGGQLESHRSA